MAWGESSTPARFGYGQSVSDDRNLFLKVFGGEVLAAFDSENLTMDKHETKTVRFGKSIQFPKVWKASAEYHVPGQEMLGNDIDTTEITITIDDILVSHVAIADLDEMLSHFEVRGQYSIELGRALAKVFDKNVFRQIILAARSSADGPFPGGSTISDASLTNTGSIDGAAWVDAIREANIKLFDKDVPDTMPRYMAVNKAVFDAIKYAQDVNGRYLVLNRDFNPGQSMSGGVQRRADVLEVDGVLIYPTKHLPSTDETSNTSVYPKYRANYSKTTGVLWTPMAVGTAKMLDIVLETERDVRRLETFMAARMLVGHGTLRPECAVEFKTT